MILAHALRLPEHARAQMISSDNLKRTLRSKRAARYPPVPSKLSDLVLPEEWTTTGGACKFVVYDNGPTATSRIILMGLEQ